MSDPNLFGQPAVVGIDLNLRATGIAGAGVLEVVRSRKSGPPHIEAIADRCLHAARGAQLVAIEGFVSGAEPRRRRAQDIVELVGVIRQDLWRAGVPLVEVHPSALARFMTGRATAAPALVAIRARAQLGYAGRDPNEARAMWLHEVALHLLDHPSAQLPAGQTSALGGIGQVVA